MGLDSDLMNEEAVLEAYTASGKYWHTEEATRYGTIRVAIQTYLAALPEKMDEEAVSEAYTASEEYWHTEEATGRGAIRVAIQTYLAALPKGEPVAWQRRHPTEGWVFVRPDDIDHYRAQGQDIRPLFVTHPAGE